MLLTRSGVTWLKVCDLVHRGELRTWWDPAAEHMLQQSAAGRTPRPPDINQLFFFLLLSPFFTRTTGTRAEGESCFQWEKPKSVAEPLTSLRATEEKKKSCRILLWVDLWWNDWTNIYSKLPPPQETFSLLKYVQNSGICFSKLWFPTTEEKSSCRSSEEAGRTLCATVTTFWKTEDPFGLIRTLF